MTFFTNARIPTMQSNKTVNVDILVENGKIISLGKNIKVGEGIRIVDLHEMLVLPGGIDPHVHFNTPGFEERETFEAGSAFAASGGITTVIDMPCTSLPPVTNVANLENKLTAISGRSCVDYALWGGVSGNCLQEPDWQENMRALWNAGVVGFKTYALSGMPTFMHLTPDELKTVVEFAGSIGALVGHHAEAAEIVQPVMAKLMAEGRIDPAAYALSRPTEAEVVAIQRIGELAKKSGTPLHIVHVSSGRGAELIAEFISQGVAITGETCPHYLAFSVDDLIAKGSVLKTAPVVKTKADSEKLWQALATGELDFIASDHAPCPPEQKQTGSIWSDYGGISGTGTLLPFLYSEGFRKGNLTLAQLVAVTSNNAARRFGLFPRKGALQVGSDADFVCIDESRNTMIHGADFPSRGKLTPFEGREFAGRIRATYLRGNLIYDDVRGVDAIRRGQLLKRN
ncbi:MAG: allantoinase AllB [Candidatus Neomarinimicrobiota bacterium]